VDGIDEPNESEGEKDCPKADSDPFVAPRAPNKDGVPTVDEEGKEELPNMQYVEIKEGTITLPEERPVDETSGASGTHFPPRSTSSKLRMKKDPRQRIA